MGHQTNAIQAAASAPENPCPEDVFAYLMDYGTGKSQVILDEWGEMATGGGPQDLLQIAPKGSYRNWFQDKSDLQKAEIAHMDPEFRSRMRVAHWSAGMGREHRRRLETFMRGGGEKDPPRALFVNIESLSKEGAARELVEEFVQQRWCYGSIDESTIIKGRKSERAKFLVRRIADDLVVRRIATGLLTPQGPMDTWMQFAFLSRKILGCRSYQDFQGRYAITRRMSAGNRTFDVIVDYRELDDLRDRIAPYSFRVLKSECLDLEPKKYVLWESEHTSEQRQHYTQLRDEAVTQLCTGEFVQTEHVMTRVMRLHQINCGFVTDEHGVVHDIPSNREKELVEILGLHRGKAVIWTPFLRTIPKIRAALEEAFGDAGGRRVAVFSGMNQKTRLEDERRFLGDPECLFMIATQGAGARGNTWVVADLEIFFANSSDLEQRNNAEDRLHRKGQTNRVTVVDMVTPDTVDMKIVRRLRKKLNTATHLTGEETREWLI